MRLCIGPCDRNFFDRMRSMLLCCQKRICRQIYESVHLEKVVALLEDKEKSVIGRKLVGRYTVESFETADGWQAWPGKSRDGIYFSDVGGCRFRVVPEGYLGERGKR